MFELALFHVNRPERERDLDADLRRRRLLKMTRQASKLEAAPARSSGARRQATNVQATER
jgi:hypothetical protein